MSHGTNYYPVDVFTWVNFFEVIQTPRDVTTSCKIIGNSWTLWCADGTRQQSLTMVWWRKQHYLHIKQSLTIKWRKPLHKCKHQWTELWSNVILSVLKYCIWIQNPTMWRSLPTGKQQLIDELLIFKMAMGQPQVLMRKCQLALDTYLSKWTALRFNAT